MIRFAQGISRVSIKRVAFQFSWKKKFEQRLKERQQEIQKMKEMNREPQEAEALRKAEENLTEQEKQVISTYKVDDIWNLVARQNPNHNYQKDLIIHKKVFEQSTEELRSAILFEDLLKTELDIAIYNTKGRPYAHHLLKFLYLLISVACGFWSIHLLKQIDEKNKVILDRTTKGKIYKTTIYLICTILFVVTLNRHRKYTKRYVQKIMYNTQNEQFTFTKRNFLGIKYNIISSRFKILYTQNKFLNAKGTNYFDIDTKEQFSIAYKNSWIKQDLFSHLISQRIKL